MTDILKIISTRATSQRLRARKDQVENSAGGYTFAIDDEARLRRFLTLGVEGGTYYAQPRELAAENAEIVMQLAETNPRLLVDIIVEVSVAGRAPRANPALFALAIAASFADDAGRTYALEKLPQVARTGTHLFIFIGYVRQFRSWGRGLRRAVADWYLNQSADKLAYQLVKYRQREGWTHRDLLRLAHPTGMDAAHGDLFAWAVSKGTGDTAGLPSIVGAYTQAQALGAAGAEADFVRLISENPGMPWETLPDVALTMTGVWEALIHAGLPQTALLRQLPRLTRLGLTGGDTGKLIARQLADPVRLHGARVHPMSVLVALRTYANGKGVRGDSKWTPERQVLDALDAAFYAAYGGVEPTGKRLLLALDVSGSMTAPISGMPLSAREATAAMALVTAATEPDYEVVAFTATQPLYAKKSASLFGGCAISKLDISPRMRLDDVLRKTDNLPFGGTDCALPMLWAAKAKVPVDTFIVYTDNETWAGDIHPYQALRQYRDQLGIPAKLVVVATTATSFSIADPSDAGMLDVAGFDSAVPNLIGDFIRGQ
ncbi:MAG: TROVE domain-containing protein [Propionibacteriaceae bacterium]|nr:TROVE domain-containing protein [Propionibacteriaceae bacterium]